MLLPLNAIDSFKRVRDHPGKAILPQVVDTVQNLDERTEIEPYLRAILTDTAETPHGPAEISDILTHKLEANGQSGLAAFILKGKSFKTVRPKDISHQIYRLEKIDGLRFAFLAASGTILDAAKEQFLSTAERIRCDYTVLDAVDLARIFVAYGFLCPRDGRRIRAGRCHCGYSPEHRILNFLQDESLRELDRAHRLKQDAGLIVLPPGSGKTRIAAQDASAAGAPRVLYVAHTHEILDVAESEFEAVFGKASVVRHKDKDTLRSPGPVNIATIQLLGKNLKLLRALEVDYLVVDEFHHAAARSYREMLGILEPPFVLGLTATPFRGDRQDITELCGGNILVNFELRSGIDGGILAPYHYYGCFDDIDYSDIRHYGRHYSVRDLDKALIIPERDEAIIQKWSELAPGKPTLAFCCSHRHARRVTEAFNTRGIPTAPYLSSTSLETRRSLIKQHQQGDLQVITTVDVLNEGADFPHVECLLLLRPTESKRVFLQQLGRGLRKYVGKSHCIVIDFIANFVNAYRLPEYHGLTPIENDEPADKVERVRSAAALLNLPLGCQVYFDHRVIDIFERQILDGRHATRHNIGRILLIQYARLARTLGRRPSVDDVRRNLLLHDGFYVEVFGSWWRFQALLPDDEELLAGWPWPTLSARSPRP